MKQYTLEQDKERYQILGLDYNPKVIGGITRFNDVDAATLETLIKKGYVETDERQNFSPSAEQFLQFMKDYKGFVAHGYIVVNDRDDRRISIEGLEYFGSDAELASSCFETWIRELENKDADVYGPDEYNVEDNYIWIWWD